MTPLGPVSETLVKDLRAQARDGLKLWLDLDGHYTALADRLAATPDLGFTLVGLRGSFLETLLALEPHTGGIDSPRVIVHVPGHNDASIATTPLFELFAAGKRYRKSLATLVEESGTGRVAPNALMAYVQAGDLTLAKADAWLAAKLDDSGQGDFARLLSSMTPRGVLDDLLSTRALAARADAEPAVIWHAFTAWTGLPESWRRLAGGEELPNAADLPSVVASWVQAVEYVDDLRRAPIDPKLAPIAALPREIKDTCRGLAVWLRAAHGDVYERTADDTEAWLSDELANARAEDLGSIDTFRFEEALVLEEALNQLGTEAFDQVLAWHADRRGSFWLNRDPRRATEWQVVEDLATLGRALQRAGTHLAASSLAEAVQRYADVGAAVDRAHRVVEQRRVRPLGNLPHLELVKSRTTQLRESWRRWADDWARDFTRLCRATSFLPDGSLQQRTLFEQVVRPLTRQPGVTAYVVVDALRYEMAQQLFAALEGTPGSRVTLSARLAELPTLTAIGMNALAPVATNGRLQLALDGTAIQGFSTGEYRVHDPTTRQKAMHHRVGGDTCPWLDLADVVHRDPGSLRQSIARAKLVVVHSEEIDKAGEKGVGPSVFEDVLQNLRAAWHKLREAGVKRFVFTADHGFLVLDDDDARQAYGLKTEARRRHILRADDGDRQGAVTVPLSDLGYESHSGLHLVMPDSVAPFDTGKHLRTFVHGGNSLQERVIPVLTVEHRNAVGGDTLRYAVRAEPLPEEGGMHRLSVKVEVLDQGALAFGGPKEIELGLRAVDAEGVYVDLRDVQGGRRVGASIYVAPDKPVELHFALTGPVDDRVQVCVLHVAAVADVEPCTPSRRFAVMGRVRSTDAPAAPPSGETWLNDLPEGGIRELFRHLAVHGTVTEADAVKMLGGPRQARRFANGFDEYAAKAPFPSRIDNVDGVKRFVKDGGSR